MAKTPSGYLVAYMQGMRRALDEWPAISHTQSIIQTEAALPAGVDEEGWNRWYFDGWHDTVERLRKTDVTIYEWEHYGRR